jgi:hypothetical protein
MDRSMLSNVMYLATFKDKRATKEDGRCHVCLKKEPLTCEHVPPKAAFNDCTSLWQRLGGLDTAKDSARRVTIKGGFWVKTLCSACNSGLCARYADAYVRFVRHLVESPRLFDSTGRARMAQVPCDTLMIAKEIATMILASEPLPYATHYHELRNFVLDREFTFRPNFSV